MAISISVSRHPQLIRSAKLSVLHRRRTGLHLGRKFYHCVNGLVCFTLYGFFLERTTALILLGTIGGALIVFDALRFRTPAINHLSLRIFGSVMRREELKSLSGNSFYIVGLFVVALFFPKAIALLAILYLAIGDPVAAIVGTSIGKHKIVGGKTLEGAMANFMAASLVTFVFCFFYFELAPAALVPFALLGGLICVIAELLPLPIDDNFTIPVISATLLQLLFTWMPVFG